MAITVWKCSTCSDGTRRRGTLMCEGCLKYEAPVIGAAARESSPAEDWRTTRSEVSEMDLRKCSECAGSFVTRRARRQDHGQNCSGMTCDLAFVSTQTNRSWIYTCEACQRHLCTDCHAKEIGKAPVTRATGLTAAPYGAASRPPRASGEHEPRTPVASSLQD